jgi:Ca-activated chloride channel family protein
MRFAYPQMLWLLAGTVLLLLWFLRWAAQKKHALARQFIQARLLPQLTVGLSARRDTIRSGLVVLAVASAFLALARPQWGFDWEEARQRGLDVVVALDTSRSMLAEDVRPNRLTRAKLAALDLMKLGRTDRFGLVAFAGTAFLQCPLTLDDEAFRQTVEALDVSIMPQGGTALADAIDIALTAFKDETDNYKVLVLMTDGEDHESGAWEAAERAAAKGLRVFTLGVGTPNGEVLRVTDEKGATSYIKDEQGNVVKSRLNEGLLQQIATAAAGFYLPLRAANAVETLYEKGLAPLPKAESSSRLIQRFHERFHWPLALAVAALIADWLLPQRARAGAERQARATPAGWRRLMPWLGLLVVGPATLQGSPARALRQYEAGRYQEAQQEFQKLLEQQPNDARLQFNAGAAAYRAGAYDQAAKSFSEALTAPDLTLQQQTYYNLGDTLYRLGESAEEPQQRMGHWRQAVKHFESALRLNPQDADARFNRDFVKRKLEELQQQQQPNSDQNSNENKPDPAKPDQSQSNEAQKADQSPEQDPDQGPSQKQPPPPEPGQPPERQEPDPKQPPQEPPADEQESPTPPQPGQDQPPPKDQPAESEAAQGRPGQMTPQQAQQLLDAQKDSERGWLFLPPRPTGAERHILKDW